MKIDDTGGKPAPLPNLSTTATRSCVVRSCDHATAPQADKVSLSGTLRALASPGDAPIDTARVDSIRAAIANGSFVADAGRIADALIASGRALAPARR